MDPQPVSFLTLEPGTAVVDCFGAHVGKVARVLQSAGHFEGVEVATGHGRRFVDAPEVRRIESHRVSLSVTHSDLLEPLPAGPRRRMLASDADREAAIAQLKLAYVTDRIDHTELERLIHLAHDARTMDDLDVLVD